VGPMNQLLKAYQRMSQRKHTYTEKRILTPFTEHAPTSFVSLHFLISAHAV